MSRLLTEEEFVIRAIKKLRGKYKSIHATYSGLNAALRQYFDRDPVEIIIELAEAGKVDTFRARCSEHARIRTPLLQR